MRGQKLTRELLKIGKNSNRPDTAVVSNTIFYESVKPFLNGQKLQQTSTSNIRSQYVNSKTPIKPVRSRKKLPASQTRFLFKPVIGNAGSARPSPLHLLNEPNYIDSSSSKQNPSINGHAARNELSKTVYGKPIIIIRQLI